MTHFKLTYRLNFVGYLLAAGILMFMPFTLFAQETASSLIAGKHGNIPAPDQIHRVLSAGPVPDVFLLSLVPEKMIGFATRQSENRKKFFPEKLRDLPSTGRIVGRGTTAPLENIIALKPDIIVDVGTVNETYLSTAQRVHEQTGVPYVIVDGRLGQSAQQLLELGELLGVPERGQQLASYAQKVLDRTHKIAQGADGKKQIRVYTGRSKDGLETGLPGAMHTEVIDWVGAYNVAAPAGEGKMMRVSMEELLLWNPDYIIANDPDFYERMSVDPLWQRIAAVQNKQYYLPSMLPYGWVDGPPGINRLLGTIWLAHVLCPEEMGDEEYTALVTEYFELFYGYTLTPEELKSLGG